MESDRNEYGRRATSCSLNPTDGHWMRAMDLRRKPPHRRQSRRSKRPPPHSGDGSERQAGNGP